VTREVLRDGTEVTIRPIRPEDEPLMVRFHETLSERSVRFRYMQWLRLEQRIGHERLIRVCFNDYDRDLALVVVRRDPATRQCEIIAVGRLVKAPGRREAEFALLVSDPFQGRGLGTALLRRVLEVARAEGLERVTASILPENHEMQRICQKFGFRLLRNLDDPEVAAVLDLGGPGPGQAAA
jgi:acetyltransferase